MLNLCGKCDQPLEEGDKITFVAIGVYHKLPSTRTWAIGKELEADIRSIKHLICDEMDGD